MSKWQQCAFENEKAVLQCNKEQRQRCFRLFITFRSFFQRYFISFTYSSVTPLIKFMMKSPFTVGIRECAGQASVIKSQHVVWSPYDLSSVPGAGSSVYSTGGDVTSSAKYRRCYVSIPYLVCFTTLILGMLI